jgi:hypothetical protein
VAASPSIHPDRPRRAATLPHGNEQPDEERYA